MSPRMLQCNIPVAGKMLRRNKVAAFVLAAALAPASALASAKVPGKVVELSVAERRALVAEIAAARAEDPAAFQAVARISGHLPEGYKKTRARRPDVVRELRAMGPAAVPAILDVLAVTGMPGGRALAESERVALEHGLVAALGESVDARALPVLRAALDAKAEAHVRAAAGYSLGRGFCESEEARLIDATNRAATKEAAIAGLAHCRRPAAAARLAALLDVVKTDAEVIALADALSRQGSEWAWQGGGAGTPEDGEKVRATAAAALVRAAARLDSAEAQRALASAVVTVAHPSTPTALAAARAAARDDAARARLDRLDRFFAARPR